MKPHFQKGKRYHSWHWGSVKDYYTCIFHTDKIAVLKNEDDLGLEHSVRQHFSDEDQYTLVPKGKKFAVDSHGKEDKGMGYYEKKD